MKQFFKTYAKAAAAFFMIFMLVVSFSPIYPVFAQEQEGGSGNETPPSTLTASVGGAMLITPTPGCRDPKATNYVSIQQNPWVQNTPSLCTYGPGQASTPSMGDPETSSVCAALAEYYDRGDSGEGVRQIQIFLNKEMGLSIPETGYFGQLTEDGVRAFQQKYSDVIIMPWEGPAPYGTTGRWYKLTAGTAMVLSGCHPAPVTLEEVNKTWDFSLVVKK